MMKRMASMAIVIAVFGLVGIVQDAQAIPSWARKYNNTS